MAEEQSEGDRRGERGLQLSSKYEHCGENGKDPSFPFTISASFLLELTLDTVKYLFPISTAPLHCRFREFSCQRQDFPIKEGPAALHAARRRCRTCERELQLHVSNYSAALEERKSGQAPL